MVQLILFAQAPWLRSENQSRDLRDETRLLMENLKIIPIYPFRFYQ